MKLKKILRNALAGTLVACVPMTAAISATRPNAAVPMASSAAVAGQYDSEGAVGVPWLPLVAVGIAVAVALFIIIDKDGDGRGAISRA